MHDQESPSTGGAGQTTHRSGLLKNLLLTSGLLGATMITVLIGPLIWILREGAQAPEAFPVKSALKHTPNAGTLSAGTGPTTLASQSPYEDLSDEEWAQYVANGTKLYGTTCIACHGPGAVGMPGLGKALANNTFVQGLDDDGLLAFIQKGRDPSDPLNTTGIGMPAKGGNPALSEDDILDIIAYLRTLQGS